MSNNDSPDPANRNWIYNTIPHYRLNKDVINDFLKKKWGDSKFFVEVHSSHHAMLKYGFDCVQKKGDFFQFWAPRKLTEVCYFKSIVTVQAVNKAYVNVIVRGGRAFGSSAQ